MRILSTHLSRGRIVRRRADLASRQRTRYRPERTTRTYSLSLQLLHAVRTASAHNHSRGLALAPSPCSLDLVSHDNDSSDTRAVRTPATTSDAANMANSYNAPLRERPAQTVSLTTKHAERSKSLCTLACCSPFVNPSPTRALRRLALVVAPLRGRAAASPCHEGGCASSRAASPMRRRSRGDHTHPSTLRRPNHYAFSAAPAAASSSLTASSPPHLPLRNLPPSSDRADPPLFFTHS